MSAEQFTAWAAEFDQAHAGVRDTVDELVTGMVSAGQRCGCGEPITASRHVAAVAEFVNDNYGGMTRSMLLAEALTRLAVAGGAK